MDDLLRFKHDSHISAIATSYTGDFVAVGGLHTIDILYLPKTVNPDQHLEPIRTFHIGSRVTALAWSRSSTSPGTDDKWSIELIAAAEDYSLHLLTAKWERGSEYDFAFGGGRSGHHGRINDISYCSGEDTDRYVATVSDDRTLIIWDMRPPMPPTQDELDGYTPLPADRAQPTAFAHPFAYPLKSVDSHPASSRDLLVADAFGNIFMTDWRADNTADAQAARRGNATELVHPRALAEKAAGHLPRSASVSWRSDTIVGGNYGSSFALWDLSVNGKPIHTGTSFADGGSRFRWSRTFPEYFAIASASSTGGAVISVWNAQHAQATPTPFPVAKKPLKVADFDFFGLPGEVPRIAAAVGHEVVIFAIGY